MGAEFPMIPRESALFSRDYQLSFLGGHPCPVTAQASAPQVPWCVLCYMLQQVLHGGLQLRDRASSAWIYICASTGVHSHSSCDSGGMVFKRPYHM